MPRAAAVVAEVGSWDCGSKARHQKPTYPNALKATSVKVSATPSSV